MLKNCSIRKYNLLLASFFSIFILSCSLFENPDEHASEYAFYFVEGKITSSNTNLPIKGIRVILNKDTLISDYDGAYSVRTIDFPFDRLKLKIKFDDADSLRDGHFNASDTSITFLSPKFVGGDGKWYKGDATKQLDVQLDTIKIN